MSNVIHNWIKFKQQQKQQHTMRSFSMSVSINNTMHISQECYSFFPRKYQILSTWISFSHYTIPFSPSRRHPFVYRNSQTHFYQSRSLAFYIYIVSRFMLLSLFHSFSHRTFWVSLCNKRVYLEILTRRQKQQQQHTL